MDKEEKQQQQEINKIVINEGDCFGWYSSVNQKCMPATCLMSERCREYTIKLQNTNGSLGIDIEERKKIEKLKLQKETEQQKRQNKKDGAKEYYDQVINLVCALVEHDDVNRNDERRYCSIKRGYKAIVKLNYTNKKVRVAIGDIYKDVPIDKDLDALKSDLKVFFESNLNED